MATYRAASSNGSMEAWYPLEGFFFAGVWAQMMRQISRRGADVGVTCNWRNVLVNPGSAVQYPGDDFLVGLSGATPMKVAEVYLEQIFSTLETVCEAQLLEDCKLWFFAPNEGSLVYCSGLDGTAPMNFGVPSLPGDRRDWKSIFTNLRTVVDALDRQKTVFPIPHPGTLYALQVSRTRTYSKFGYWESPDVVAGTAKHSVLVTRDDFPESEFPNGAGYCLDVEADHDFPGWGALDEDAGYLSTYGPNPPMGFVCIAAPHYRWPIMGGGAIGVVNASASGTWTRCWRGCGRVDLEDTYSFDADDWAEFEGLYGDVVNDIAWGFTVAVGDGSGSDKITFTGDGDGSFEIVGNVPAVVNIGVEAALVGGPYKVFADYSGSEVTYDRQPASVAFYDFDDAWDYSETGWPAGDVENAIAGDEARAFTVTVEPSAEEGTACDIVE